MIEQLSKPFSEKESLAVLNRHVREWFQGNFEELTPPQRFAFKLISENHNTLITAPTGSGKTISGFMSIISRLFDYSIAGKLEDRVYCVYVSPLRSLNNDIFRNLTKPLDEIHAMVVKEKVGEAEKESVMKVRIAVRTGDTTQQERRQQLAHPPHILVTTPESLAILINSKRFVEHLKGLEFLIIDELHELASNKRGVHLSLSVERLVEIIGRDITRVGLGATLYPLEEAARFLVGSRDGEPRDCKVVDASWQKKLDVRALSPVKDLIYTENEAVEDSLYGMLNDTIKANRTTLIFTNTRSGTERVVFNLKSRFKYGEDIAAHHSSLSRDSRMEVEDLLKKGSLKCAVTSTSLELGVDIGSIDTVVQLGSPKSVTRAIQRIGRAGHSYKETAKGEVIALDRDDMVECAVMLGAALKRHLDSFSVPKNALDVLAQHMVGMSLTDKWNADRAYDVVRRAYPYATLDRHDFYALIDYLAGNYVGLESRRVYGKIWYDKVENTFGKRGRLAQAIYMLNMGTIPDEVAIAVITTGKKWVGNIEEEFLTRLKPGDIFALGGRLYRFEYARGMKCHVTEAKATAPTIPPWFSEQLPLSYELASEIGAFRARLSKAMSKPAAGRSVTIPKEAGAVLDSIPIDANARSAIYGYFREQLLFTGVVPTDKLIVIEETSDLETGETQLVFHALFGRRVNDALSRAMAVEIGELLDEDIGIMVSDNGFVLNLADADLSKKQVESVIAGLASTNISAMLKQNIRKTEMMKRRFRHVAGRGFMILRNYKGWKISVGKQQFNSQLLLKAVEEMDQNFPILKETYREILNDVMDLPRAQELLSGIRRKEVRCRFIRTEVPSPFSHKMVTFGHADVIMMKSRRMYLQKLHRSVMDRIARQQKVDGR